MSSQFFGLFIAQSGLNAFQASINTTANNISNVQTKGYSRQEVVLKATSSLRAYQRYGSVSSGVSPEEVIQLRDKYYDNKYWINQSSYGYYDSKIYQMTQIEDYFTDTKANQGFTTIFSTMFNSLDAIKSNPSDSSIRAQFVNDAEKLSRYFNTTSTKLAELQSSVNEEIKAQVDEINSIASKIAILNKQINTIEVNKSNANELRDERALLIDKLSEIIAIETEEEKVIDPNFPQYDTGLTVFNIKINGQSLVSTGEYNKLSVVSRDKRDNLMDIDGLYDIKWENTGVSLALTGYNQSGRLRALVEIRDGNDASNIQGLVVSEASSNPGYVTDGKHIVIEGSNYTDPAKISFPPTGEVTIKGVDYKYDSFDVQLDSDGKISAIRFNLTGALTTDQQMNIKGSKAAVGDTIDCKGIPYYQNEMNTFLRAFTKAFNDIEKEGEDLYGNKGRAFFVAKDRLDGKELIFKDGLYDPGSGKTEFNSSEDTYFNLTASSMWVNSDIHNDLKLFASAVYKPDSQGVDDSTLVEKLKTLQDDVVLYRSGGASAFLETIYSDVTVDTKEATMFKDYYTNIQKSIDKQRGSISGVDEDEEAQNLVKFQGAYNLNSKVISILAEMYDQLILNTGL